MLALRIDRTGAQEICLNRARRVIAQRRSKVGEQTVLP